MWPTEFMLIDPRGIICSLHFLVSEFLKQVILFKFRSQGAN